MATKLAVPRPSTAKKVPPQEIALEATDLVEEPDHTEPSGPPVLPGIPIGTPGFAETAAPERAPTPPPAPISSSILNLGPAIAPAPRPVAASLPSDYELESRRKSSPPVAERRRELAKYVASAVGVAWFICTCAVGETALRSIIASMH